MKFSGNAVYASDWFLDFYPPEELIPTKKAVFLGGFLCLLQVLDAWLTFIGVSRFGLSVEGNPIIRTLMENYGEAFALSFFKTISIIAVVFITLSANQVSWLVRALSIMNCLYVVLAILPWTYLLFIQPNLA